MIDKIMVDTHHFKGNYPDACSIEICNVNSDEEALEETTNWKEILAPSKLSAHNEHTFLPNDLKGEEVSHVRMFIYPDGGVSRLRLWGRIS